MYDPNMRSIVLPFVVTPPAGTRVRARLRLDAADEAVLRAVGDQLGRLASTDLAARCAIGHGDEQRADRKRALTAHSSSRWAGTITRTSNDQWTRAFRNLVVERASLRRRVRIIDRRLDVPVGGRVGRLRGYASQAERWAKQQRRQRLNARLAKVDTWIAAGSVGVVRGGRRLAKARHQLQVANLSLPQWRKRWQAKRWFLCADGENEKPWGNETIRWHPDQRWLEVKLPPSFGHLANRPHSRYRLGCLVKFTYRGDHVAAQAAGGAVRYDITFDPERGRWYLDASWRLMSVPVPTLKQLREYRRLSVDLNAGHLACWVLNPDGNPLGGPRTIPMALAGLATTTRDGRLRAAISQLLTLAKISGCRTIAIEDLDFADNRQAGREPGGRGERSRHLRRTITGIPTRAFRDRLVQMAYNQGLWVVAVDPAYTSKWGASYWHQPLNSQTRPSVTVSGHHAAAVVIGRRSLGYRARRRPGVPRPHQRMGKGELPARPRTAVGCEGPGPPTRPAGSIRSGAQDRLGRPEGTRRPGRPKPFGTAGQDQPLLILKERSRSTPTPPPGSTAGSE
jgi:hypothetical protein